MQVADAARITRCCVSGVGSWLWLRLDPLAWESPYAAGAAQEIAKRQKKKKKGCQKRTKILFLVYMNKNVTKNIPSLYFSYTHKSYFYISYIYISFICLYSHIYSHIFSIILSAFIYIKL